MVNLEHNLTVDDLIVEYMMYKVNNGYEPQFLTSEFINFLSFFESKMPVQDSLHENEKLFQRFFERKAESDWSSVTNWNTNEKQVTPHMNMIYSENDDDYIIKANYKLSEFDRSVINTYFMPGGRYGEGKTKEIRNLIGEYLSEQPKRGIDDTIEIDETTLMVGKYLTAEIIKNIWNSHISKQVEYHKWPEQCKDIDKYLFKIDLAEIIGLKSMRKELLDFYRVISRRIAILYQQDKTLKISNCSGGYLARANYELLINGYQNIFGIAFGEYKSSMNIDLESSTFKESHEIDGVYMWDEDPDIKTTTTQIGNDSVKKLVRTLDKNIQNN